MQVLRRSAPPVTAEVLAHETGVSMRTLYRDIDALRGLGAVIDGTAGYGYVLTEDAALPPLMFDDEEIEALVLGLREVQSIADPALVDAATAALGKLQARLPERQAHRLKHAVLNARRFRTAPTPSIEVRALRQATWDELTVQFGYEDGKGTVTERAVDPLGIVYLDATHCLLAFCHLRQDFRAFRLDRMNDLTVTEHSFRPNRVPQLRTYVARLKAENY
jgi:predicted DNA-binding transcriptional regulator YafY